MRSRKRYLLYEVYHAPIIRVLLFKRNDSLHIHVPYGYSHPAVIHFIESFDWTARLRGLRLVSMMATEKLEREEPEEISVLHRVSRIVSSELSLDEMLGEIVGLTSQISGCDACLVYLVEMPTEEFVLRASQVPHAADLGNLRMKVGEGVTGWVAEHQAPVALTSKA